MRIVVHCFGKLRIPGMRETADFYLKRFRTWGEIQERELRAEPISDKSRSCRARVMEREDQILLASLGAPTPRFYLLSPDGKPKESMQWAEALNDWQRSGANAIHLCIGASLGFSATMRKRASGLLGLGPQIFAHELARIALYEQLYRAASINGGHPYHNGGLG